MRSVIFSAVAFATIVAPVWSETCSFTKECIEAEACQDTDFTLEIAEDRLITDAETIPVSQGGSETIGVFVGYTNASFHLLTREKGGQARYVTHLFQDIMQVTYVGTCSE